ncbi:MAG TPA: DNA polymerase III subunit gamma and tau [Pseudolysinimonas sp.]|nr:DNA polymerase III subunit gamma and tau [Pseudolysinimonas sp.]
MVTALYRRYRPETFAELIGQSQVTDPLRTALRTDRVNHAYLFSGPRGCGKTTSARILARCLNCAEGPTDTPCGVCPSCRELARDGGGSLDVVEIDAASHGGVDDARDLRERAVFAPARDRYKIFIVDEAHMVTSGGFNALLKIVEEPPEHVKFIFATTEPEKVISTIRSRTHHYPFRLVPPAQMLDYVQQLCESEHVTVAPGVLPLVVRAGGGSVRDTLSLLDQLIAGSDDDTVEYERAVALLGYTHGALLDEVVDAVGAMDAAAAFAAVDRVVQTGQDPRRFVEDLLERLRDLIVVAATRDAAASVMRGVPQDELDHMAAQAQAFGAAQLSRAADVVNTALTEMTGATSPRLHLELMVARLLVPAADDSDRGALARVERLERRVGVSDEVVAAPREEPRRKAPHAEVTPEAPAAVAKAEAPAAVAEAAESDAPDRPLKPVTASQLRDAWPEVLEVMQKAHGRRPWSVVATTTVHAFDGEVLTLQFSNESDVASFRPAPGSAPGQSVSEQLRAAILEVLGVRVKFLPRVEPGAPAPAELPEQAAPRDAPPVAAEPEPDEPEPKPDSPEPESASPEPEPEPASPEPESASPEPQPKPAPEPEPKPAPDSGWNVAEIPGAATQPPAEATAAKPAAAASAGPSRYGEAVVRELLNASFIEETSLAPRDRAVPLPEEQ